jgi:chemotaxis protein methyltransferase CheR
MSSITFSDQHFSKICSLMYEAIGLSFNESKKHLISSRITPRILKLGLAGFDDYIELMEDESENSEFQMAVDLLTTNETYFFREPNHYGVLENELKALKSNGPLRIWSAASSFGDEAYSTCMLLMDMQTAGRIGPDWSILATDISHRVLLSAKQAVYPLDRLRQVEPERLRRYCLKGEGPSEGMVQIQPALRERVQFGQLNLCKPFDELPQFDVIFLRNVLIYFDVPTKIEVVDQVLKHLRPGGLFFMGTAEGRVACKTPLENLQPGAFRKAAGS